MTFQNEIPEDLTADKYLIMYKKIWAIIRHDLYREIQRELKKSRVEQLSEEVFNKLYEEQHKNFEKIRLEVYQMIMKDDEIEGPKAREYMQKAFCTHSTISAVNRNLGQNESAKVAHWPNLVN